MFKQKTTLKSGQDQDENFKKSYTAVGKSLKKYFFFSFLRKTLMWIPATKCKWEISLSPNIKGSDFDKVDSR